MKYLAQLKSEKRAVEVLPKLPKAPKLEKQLLPKLPKAPFDSKDSTDARHFQKNSPELIPGKTLPEWQESLCEAHGDFNRWRGCCPVSLSACLISRVTDSGGDLDKLRGLDLGRGISTDAVIALWLESGEPPEVLINQPAWFICLAEHLAKGGGHGRISEA